jgi:hypothetical protein
MVVKVNMATSRIVGVIKKIMVEFRTPNPDPDPSHICVEDF